jgi:hypothetical protein
MATDGVMVEWKKLLLEPSSTESSCRDEIFVNKTTRSTPPCRGGMLNPDYALGIKELVYLLRNPSDCHLTLTNTDGVVSIRQIIL